MCHKSFKPGMHSFNALCSHRIWWVDLNASIFTASIWEKKEQLDYRRDRVKSHYEGQ